ncbi:MAG: ABC transporter ATP-binding protein [Gammaproteobacteria bacterium]|nr:ABC transporter ATP-binding protein [Gammaproteobacteria bacterium]
MNDCETVIDIQDMEFRWQTSGPLTLAIHRFQVSGGERLFIKGASGSGKSTLLNLLGGVMTPQRGEIRVLGQTINRLRGAERDRFRADHVGFIFQMFNLIPYLSVMENVLLPLHFSRNRYLRVTQRGTPVQEAARLLSHLDLDGEEIQQREVTALSVGQQQRVAAARALIGSPEIVIADEPTSSLDSDRREAFIKLLIHECELAGTTLLFVSHDSSLESAFDRSVALGQINGAVPTSTTGMKGV